MLRTPKLHTSVPLSVLSDGRASREIGVGMVETFHFNLDMEVWDGNHPADLALSFYAHPWLGDDLEDYGVCDTPAAFMERFGKRLIDDARTFVVGFTHIEKDPENAGRGGGWRWHKWGPYVGTGTPTTEYLDDEPGFPDGVWVYTILQIDGPLAIAPWEQEKPR